MQNTRMCLPRRFRPRRDAFFLRRHHTPFFPTLAVVCTRRKLLQSGHFVVPPRLLLLLLFLLSPSELYPYAVTPFDLMNFKIMPAAYEIRASIFAEEQSRATTRGRAVSLCVCVCTRECDNAALGATFPKTKHETSRRTRKIRAGCVPERRVN